MEPQPFVLDLFGQFGPGSVRVVWQAAETPDHPAVAQLKAAWPRHVAEVTGRGGVLFNGRMVRCLGYRIEGGLLTIDAGPTDYATYYCTNYLNHYLGDQIGWEHFANPIGISANVITADGWILYGRRNQRVATHPGVIHTFGGTVDRDDLNPAGDLDVFASMARELHEELQLAEGELGEQVCLGMIRDPQLRNPELIFDSPIAATRSELESRLTADDLEHQAIVATRDEPAAISAFLRTPDCVPVMIGSLLLHVRVRFGEDAYSRLCCP